MLTREFRLPFVQMLTVGMLPSALQRLYYRWKGYRVGKGVRFGPGSVVLGDEVEIGEDTRIGFLTVIAGKRIRIGADVSVGGMTVIHTYDISIGDGARINNQVVVGGMQSPRSSFELGRNTILMEWSFVNTTYPVKIGDDTGIGGHCLLFTHGVWPSILDGYPVSYDSIEIGSGVWLPWRVTVLPGTRIGDGTVIGANSLVKGRIPERCLASGTPAKVLKESGTYPRPLSAEKQLEKFGQIIVALREWLEFHGNRCRQEGHTVEVTWTEKSLLRGSRSSSGRILVDHDAGVVRTQEELRGHAVWLSLRGISADLRATASRTGVLWIDLETKERGDLRCDLGDEVAAFLRRYGIRLSRTAPSSLSPSSTLPSSSRSS